ncbi:MAG: DUF2892 domain-containing protein [Alphaproteobacteria bacterium]|nr:MAG: DUF2892 domain-containing protein [Alphaproteobacteria bacterium]
MNKLFCTKNVGDRERLLRAILGIVLMLLHGTGNIAGTFGIVVLVLGIVLILTAATGSCCLYTMMGKSSCEGGSCSMDKK